jgi:hypothetical protein
VLVQRTADGGCSVKAHDTDPPRDFPLDSVLRNGTAIDADIFAWLCAYPR